MQQAVGLIQLAEILINAAECVIEFGLHRGLALERLRFLHAAIDERDHPQIFRRASVLIAAVEEIEHEALDAFGPFGL